MAEAKAALEIEALEMSGGDPGYFSRGHVEKALFVEQVNRDYEEEFEAEEAEHLHVTEEQPDGACEKPEEYDTYFWLCKADAPGAFPATMVRV